MVLVGEGGILNKEAEFKVQAKELTKIERS